MMWKAFSRVCVTLYVLCVGFAILKSQTSTTRNVSSIPHWEKYYLEAIANGTATCVAANGCWSVNGQVVATKDAAFFQTVTLTTLPANTIIFSTARKTAVAFTGTTTASAQFGLTGFSTIISAGAYDLMAAVSDTNFENSPYSFGNVTRASIGVTTTITTTVQQVDQIATGSALVVHVLSAVIP